MEARSSTHLRSSEVADTGLGQLRPNRDKASPAMDHFDCERYISIYKMLAEILERDRPPGSEEHHLSYTLGDLARRVFVDSTYLPPDELLEETARALRSSDRRQLRAMAHRLRDHAHHLGNLDE